MSRERKKRWAPWHQECKRYIARTPQGFEADANALEAHRDTLLKLAPKDCAGRPVQKALEKLTVLTTTLVMVRDYQCRHNASVRNPSDGNLAL